MPSEASLDAYMGEPRRLAMAAERDAASVLIPQVAFGHAPVEADHGEVIWHEIACPVQRGDQRSVGPDPGREVSVPGVRQHPSVQQAHRDIHHGAAEREV